MNRADLIAINKTAGCWTIRKSNAGITRSYCAGCGMIIEPIGTQEFFVEGTGNFTMKNGILRFACYSYSLDGTKTASCIIRSPVHVAVETGAHIRAILDGNDREQMRMGLMWV